MKSTVHEPAREIPVTHTADLVIAGGGTAGTACAICAARLGLSVIMVENSSQPGGMLTHVTQWSGDFDNKGGFCREFYDYVITSGIMERPYYNPNMVLPYLEKLICEANIKTLYLCRVVAPVMTGNTIEGIIVESKQGRHAVMGKIVIDATGDGDVAAWAGAEFEFGRESDGEVQSVSLTHFINNFPNDKTNIRKELLPLLHKINPDYQIPYANGNLMRQVGTKSGLMIGLSHVTGCNPLNAESLSDALVELRRQCAELFTLLKQTSLGKDIEFGHFSALPGVRESRRIVCDEMLTLKDMDEGRKREDGIFTAAHAMDIHKCLPDEPDIIVRKVKPYHIPYGSLLPKGIDNLMAIGRCIGGSHEALASYRLIGDCFAMGEAAALASLQSVKANARPRTIDVNILKDLMIQNGYEL